LVADEPAQGCSRQHVLDPVLRLLEQPANGAAADVFTNGMGQFATLKNNFALDGFDDFKDGDLRRLARENEPAAGAAGGAHQARLDEMLKNLGQETARDVFGAALRG
jgi:hypothetical protein